MRRFEDLRIWQESRIFVQEIYFLNKDLKDYGFKDQIQRASVSIMNNIAEGCDSGTDSLYVRAQRKNKTNYIRHSKKLITYLKQS